MTTLTITSALATAPGVERGRLTRWTGTVEQTGIDPEGLDATELLESIFRKFNRVTEEDCELLDRLGYQLPSMSVGDEILLDGVPYLCAPSGWQEVR